MWQRRSSQSEPPFSSTSPANPAYAYHSSPAYPSSQMSSRRGPVEAPPGHQLRRRVTWRSSAYKIIAYLYVLGILYIVWLIRDLFWLPFSPSPSANRQPKEQDLSRVQHILARAGGDNSGCDFHAAVEEVESSRGSVVLIVEWEHHRQKLNKPEATNHSPGQPKRAKQTQQAAISKQMKGVKQKYRVKSKSTESMRNRNDQTDSPALNGRNEDGIKRQIMHIASQEHVFNNRFSSWHWRDPSDPSKIDRSNVRLKLRGLSKRALRTYQPGQMTNIGRSVAKESVRSAYFFRLT